MSERDFAAATVNSPLTPSLEKAYHLKCIQLKKRLREIEESNDAARVRVERVERGITKMRIERALLLDALVKRQNKVKDYDSDKTSTAPPSTTRKRTRRPDRVSPAPAPISYPSHNYSHVPQHIAPPIAQFQPPISHQPHVPNPYSSISQPLIRSLPNGTSVMLVAPGKPKPSPWVLAELDPRHHYKREFEDWPLDQQEFYIFEKDYLPFDVFGVPILVEFDEQKGKYIHILPSDAAWKDPVENSVRMDTAKNRVRQMPRKRDEDEKE